MILDKVDHRLYLIWSDFKNSWRFFLSAVFKSSFSLLGTRLFFT